MSHEYEVEVRLLRRWRKPLTIATLRVRVGDDMDWGWGIVGGDSKICAISTRRYPTLNQLVTDLGSDFPGCRFVWTKP